MNRIVVSIGLILAVASLASAADARLGAQFAYATEQGNMFRSGPSSRTQLAMFQPQLSVTLLRAAGNPQVELFTEYTAAKSLRPVRGKFLHFINVGGRFHLWPTHPVGSYLELGAGMGLSHLYTDKSNPTPREDPVFRQLTGPMQYHLQVGGGLRINAGKSRLHLGYRLTHFSNNGLELPNLGLNLHTLLIGYQSPPF